MLENIIIGVAIYVVYLIWTGKHKEKFINQFNLGFGKKRRLGVGMNRFMTEEVANQKWVGMVDGMSDSLSMTKGMTYRGDPTKCPYFKLKNLKK